MRFSPFIILILILCSNFLYFSRNVAREDAKAAARAAAIIENRRDLKNQMDEQERAAHEAHIKQQKDKEDFVNIRLVKSFSLYALIQRNFSLFSFLFF